MTSILMELNKDYATAADWLLFYEDKKEQFYEDSKLIRDGSNYFEVYSQTGPGNVVLQKVVSLAELDRAERWLLTIELVESTLSPKKKVFLAVRRAARRKNQTVNGHEVWRGYVQKQYAEEMARKYGTDPEKFWLGDQTITIWWKEMVELTRTIGYKKGCYEKTF